jgi:hypothetical protein
MNLREALIAQSPSLALQRAAQIEIARLDSRIQAVRQAIKDFDADIARLGRCNEPDDYEDLKRVVLIALYVPLTDVQTIKETP